jgi:hypothetical protein
MQRMIIHLFCYLILFLFCHNVFADDAETELAKKSENPVEKMVTVPFNNNFNYGFGPNNNTQYILDMKPVIPFTLSDTWNLITRTIIPVIDQPNLLGRGSINGIGDINPTLFLSPAHPGKILWGLGPAFLFPTASNIQLGQGKYSIGPSAVVLTMPGNWVIGVLMSNYWSVGGDSNRKRVNQFLIQYFINYNFKHGWFITSAPIVTANWVQNSKNRWTIPFGAGVGRVFNIGKQSISTSIQAYDNAVTPKLLGPQWQLQLNISLLFPMT